MSTDTKSQVYHQTLLCCRRGKDPHSKVSLRMNQGKCTTGRTKPMCLMHKPAKAAFWLRDEHSLLVVGSEQLSKEILDCINKRRIFKGFSHRQFHLKGDLLRFSRLQILVPAVPQMHILYLGKTAVWQCHLKTELKLLKTEQSSVMSLFQNICSAI